MSEILIPKDIDILKIDLSKHDAKVRADAIKEVLKVADCSHTDCWDCAFADADLCKLQMLYKYWNS